MSRQKEKKMQTVEEMMSIKEELEKQVVKTIYNLMVEQLKRSTESPRGTAAFIREDVIPLEEAEDLQEKYLKNEAEWRKKGINEKNLKGLIDQAYEELEEFLNQKGWKLIRNKTFIAPHDSTEV